MDGPPPIAIRRLERTEMPALARFYREVFEATFPWIPPLHTPAEDRHYFCGELFDNCQLWGTEADGRIAGFIALAPGWIDKLYVSPSHHGRGLGRGLIQFAKASGDDWRLWTFARNARARRFYEVNGFRAIGETDGSGNEEREPDLLYHWRG